MKKLISLILCCLICGIASAQLIKQKVEKQKKQSELDWYNCSFDRDSVYGAEVNKAYEYLNANKKKLMKRPIVALIWNRNGRGTRRSETGYMDQSQRKIKSKR